VRGFKSPRYASLSRLSFLLRNHDDLYQQTFVSLVNMVFPAVEMLKRALQDVAKAAPTEEEEREVVEKWGNEFAKGLVSRDIVWLSYRS
jgi:hypothetical protein